MSTEKEPATFANGRIILRQRVLKKDWQNGFPPMPDHTIFVFQRDTNGDLVRDEEGHLQPVFRGTPPCEPKPF